MASTQSTTDSSASSNGIAAAATSSSTKSAMMKSLLAQQQKQKAAAAEKKPFEYVLFHVQTNDHGEVIEVAAVKWAQGEEEKKKEGEEKGEASATEERQNKTLSGSETREFQKFCRPVRGVQVSEKRQKRTGIQTEDLHKASSFLQVFLALTKWLQPFTSNVSNEDYILVSCGEQELRGIIPAECLRHNIQSPAAAAIFGNSFINLKTFYSARTGKKKTGLPGMLQELKLAGIGSSDGVLFSKEEKKEKKEEEEQAKEEEEQGEEKKEKEGEDSGASTSASAPTSSRGLEYCRSMRNVLSHILSAYPIQEEIQQKDKASTSVGDEQQSKQQQEIRPSRLSNSIRTTTIPWPLPPTVASAGGSSVAEEGGSGSKGGDGGNRQRQQQGDGGRRRGGNNTGGRGQQQQGGGRARRPSSGDRKDGEDRNKSGGRKQGGSNSTSGGARKSWDGKRQGQASGSSSGGYFHQQQHRSNGGYLSSFGGVSSSSSLMGLPTHHQMMGSMPVATGPRPQKYDYFCILDFEATCDSDRSFQPQEIIEWPTVLLNTRTLEVEAEFQMYIKPVMKPQLTPFCTEFTGIRQETVDELGQSFPQVMEAYDKWLRDMGLIEEEEEEQQQGGEKEVEKEKQAEGEKGGDKKEKEEGGVASSEQQQQKRNNNRRRKRFAFVTCGDWDLKTMLPNQIALTNKLQQEQTSPSNETKEGEEKVEDASPKEEQEKQAETENVDESGLKKPEYFAEWINIKRVFGRYYNKQRPPTSLSQILKALGLHQEGLRSHSGLDDCRNIMRIVIRMMNDGILLDHTWRKHYVARQPASPNFNSFQLSSPQTEEQKKEEAGDENKTIGTAETGEEESKQEEVASSSSSSPSTSTTSTETSTPTQQE
ncbi:ERI1 exoribonuclease 3 [Balamuthia mandrillaris]